jgi:hypothetical protein
MPNLEASSSQGALATLWAFAGYDPDGEPTVNEPEEISCRWVRKESAQQSAENTPHGISDTLLTQTVITIGSIVARGAADDIVGTGTGLENDADIDGGLRIVVGVDRTDDIKTRNVMRSYQLAKYSASLPRVV